MDRLFDFSESLYEEAERHADKSHMTKTANFKIQDGGGHHFENRFFGHISSTDCPISAKFCTKIERHVNKGYHKNCKFLKSKMADGCHFENC